MNRSQVVSNHLRIQTQVRSQRELANVLNQLDRSGKTLLLLRTMNLLSVVRRLPELKFPAAIPHRNATRRLRNAVNHRNGLRRLAVSHHQDHHGPIPTSDHHVPNPNALNQHGLHRRVPKPRGLSHLVQNHNGLNLRVRSHHGLSHPAPKPQDLNHRVRNRRDQNHLVLKHRALNRRAPNLAASRRAIQTPDDQANRTSRFGRTRSIRQALPTTALVQDLPVVSSVVCLGTRYS